MIMGTNNYEHVNTCISFYGILSTVNTNKSLKLEL